MLDPRSRRSGIPSSIYFALPSFYNVFENVENLLVRTVTHAVYILVRLRQISLRERQYEMTDDLPPVVVQSFDESFELLGGMAHHAIFGRLIMIRGEQGSTPKIKRAFFRNKYRSRP